jgi:nucleotide-binding universal stress UspA family protein
MAVCTWHSLHAQEDMMKTLRWLLPFTHGVDMRTIDYLIRLAENAGATLVTVSLVSVPHKPWAQGARLEHIQQSKDFLEALQYRAARLRVSVERYEVFTADVVQSITILAHEWSCEKIILVTSGEKALLLRDHEMKQLLLESPVSLVVLRLVVQPAYSSAGHPVARFLSWLRRYSGPQDESYPVWSILAVEGHSGSGGENTLCDDQFPKEGSDEDVWGIHLVSGR